MQDDCGRPVIKTYHSILGACTRPYRAHHHTECELSIFLRGDGIYAMQGKEYPFSAGDIFLFGTGETHSITEIRTDMEVLNVHFEPRILWEHSDTAELLGLFSSRSDSFENRFADEGGEIQKKILALECEIAEKKPCFSINARYLLFSILSELIRRYNCVKPAAPAASTAGARNLRRAIDYIGENLSEPLTLAAIADVAYMSPTYFSAVFKKLNGISPWEYITIKRVEKAVHMLKTTDLTKIEIAERCGFSGASNFYKMFRRVTGKRPSDFKGAAEEAATKNKKQGFRT